MVDTALFLVGLGFDFAVLIDRVSLFERELVLLFGGLASDYGRLSLVGSVILDDVLLYFRIKLYLVCHDSFLDVLVFWVVGNLLHLLLQSYCSLCQRWFPSAVIVASLVVEHCMSIKDDLIKYEDDAIAKDEKQVRKWISVWTI